MDNRQGPGSSGQSIEQVAKALECLGTYYVSFWNDTIFVHITYSYYLRYLLLCLALYIQSSMAWAAFPFHAVPWHGMAWHGMSCPCRAED